MRIWENSSHRATDVLVEIPKYPPAIRYHNSTFDVLLTKPNCLRLTGNYRVVDIRSSPPEYTPMSALWSMLKGVFGVGQHICVLVETHRLFYETTGTTYARPVETY
jgi:hypothetical protein